MFEEKREREISVYEMKWMEKKSYFLICRTILLNIVTVNK